MKDNVFYGYCLLDKYTNLPKAESGLDADTICDIMFFETREKAIHHKNIDYLYNADVVKIKIVLCGED